MGGQMVLLVSLAVCVLVETNEEKNDYNGCVCTCACACILNNIVKHNTRPCTIQLCDIYTKRPGCSARACQRKTIYRNCAIRAYVCIIILSYISDDQNGLTDELCLFRFVSIRLHAGIVQDLTAENTRIGRIAAELLKYDKE